MAVQERDEKESNLGNALPASVNSKRVCSHGHSVVSIDFHDDENVQENLQFASISSVNGMLFSPELFRKNSLKL